LVIAVQSNSTYGTDETDFEDVLYGAVIGRRPAAAEPQPGALLKPGRWLSYDSWRHANLPQVIAAQGPVPMDGRQGPAPLVEHAPARGGCAGAARLAPACPGHRARATARPTLPLSSLFGLPDPWPTVPPNLSFRPAAAL
jgi:hypothetical protein